jgi:hypothetical protein
MTKNNQIRHKKKNTANISVNIWPQITHIVFQLFWVYTNMHKLIIEILDIYTIYIHSLIKVE